MNDTQPSGFQKINEKDVRGAVDLTVNFYRVALLTTVLEKLKTTTVY
jgi:hypothetical protein